MNERIKELADRASEHMHQQTGQTWGIHPAIAEVFAQMVAQECANIALREDHDPYECILKHFGVE